MAVETALHEVRAREAEAQALALVRAVEESDRRGEVLPHNLRRQATTAAREAGDRGWLARRALTLAAELERQWEFLPRLLRWTSPGRGLWLPAALVAFIAGLATNALGPARQVHVLALPLAGILAWNLAVLLLLAARRWLPLPVSIWRGGRPVLLDVLESWSQRLIDRKPGGRAADDDLVQTSLSAYLKIWFPVVAPLAATRVRRLLHLAALALLAGLVGGMYLRGVGFEYTATWESTFASARTVQAVLAVLLGPAAAILGMDLPSVQATGGSAAPWIHLWAVTAALFVGLPRAALTLAESVRAAVLARRLPVRLPEGYLRRLLAAASTSSHRVEVVPYSYHPPTSVADKLRAQLLDVFGARAEIRVRPAVDYGTEAADLELPGGRCWLILFNLSQTPEMEVHGALMAALREELPDGQSLLTVVDGSGYRERLAPGKAGEKRWGERCRAWDRVIAEAGLEPVHLDLRRDDDDTVIAALLAGEWPGGGG